MGIFVMPSLGSDMEAGTLVEWLVKPGDRVKRGDIVAVVETQKGAVEIEVYEEGEIARLLVEIGQTVPVGTPLAEIASAVAERGAQARERPAPAVEPPAKAAEAAASPASRAPGPPPAPRDRTEPAATVAHEGQSAQAGEAPPASPAARVRAQEAGVALDEIAGSGPNGAVLLRDVEAVLTGRGAKAERPTAVAPAKQARATSADPLAMRAAIAAAMSRSKREIPHYYLAHEVDLHAATDWLAATNADRPPERRLVMGLLLVRATALAARRTQQVNGHYVDGAHQPSEAVHAGVAVALRGGGLVAPALHHADSLGLDELMEGMRDLVTRARTGRLRSSELADPTVTVSSLGDRGVDAMQGVIFPPQVALVGFGTPVRRAVVRGDAVVPSITITATLAADHRVSDGRTGARFLADLADLLQHPEEL
jgi:pyruvate dehydrogenase E2 component (dihydrolipoamide acetyltransferase)